MMTGTDVQLTCEWKCLCPCGVFRVVTAESRPVAEDRLRQSGWRKSAVSGDNPELEWRCQRCVSRKALEDDTRCQG